MTLGGEGSVSLLELLKGEKKKSFRKGNESLTFQGESVGESWA